MGIHSALESAANGFVERGRTLRTTHTIDLAEAADRPEFQSLSGSHDDLTHLDVIVADGPFGPEVLVQARSGEHGLPGELYAQVAGAFGAPAAFDKASGQGFAWTSPSTNLQEYLQTHQFGAPELPGGQRSGSLDIDMGWTVQVIALGPARSMVACQLSSDAPTVVAQALSTIDRLAQVTAQSKAAGAQGGLHPFRFGFLVQLALGGQLDAPPPPAAPAPVAMQPPPPAAPTPAPAPVAMQPPPPAAPAPAAPAPAAPAPAAPAPAAPAPAPIERELTDISLMNLDVFNTDDAELDSDALYDMSATSWGASAPGAAAIDVPARVAEALGRYAGRRVIVGQITDPKKLANVQRGIGPDVDPETICGFVDTGARANGKVGMVFTTTGLHFCGLSSRLHYDYTALEAFELESTAVVISGADGTRAKISAAGQSLAIAEAIAAATGLSV